MTNAIAFDTHRFIQRMTDVGFTTAQAEALSDEQVKLINSNLATKHDIEGLKVDIEGLRLATKHDIEELRLATKHDIEAAKSEQIKWTISAIGVYTGIIALLIYFL